MLMCQRRLNVIHTIAMADHGSSELLSLDLPSTDQPIFIPCEYQGAAETKARQQGWLNLPFYSPHWIHYLLGFCFALLVDLGQSFFTFFSGTDDQFFVGWTLYRNVATNCSLLHVPDPEPLISGPRYHHSAVWVRRIHHQNCIFMPI